MHEMHTFGYIQGHFVPLFEGDMRNRRFLLVKHFEQSSTMTELCDYDWVALVCCRTHEEHEVWVTDVGQGFNLPLELDAELPVYDQALDFELLHSNIGEFILGLIDNSSSSFANLLQVGQLSKINLQELSSCECIIKELAGQIPLLVLEIWLESLLFRGFVAFLF